MVCMSLGTSLVGAAPSITISCVFIGSRSVQVPSSQPGHNVKRKRRENEAEYTYRKRLAAENAISTNMNEIHVADDPAAETAMSIQPSLKYIMQLNKAQLQAKIADSSESVEILKQHGSMKTDC